MDGILLLIYAPIFSILLSTFNLLIRLSHGSVRKAGGDLLFAAASIEIGFFSVDLNQKGIEFLVTDIMMFLIFICMWATILWYLKVDQKCLHCSQYLEPSHFRSTSSIIIGYGAVCIAIVLRLSVQGIILWG